MSIVIVSLGGDGQRPATPSAAALTNAAPPTRPALKRTALVKKSRRNTAAMTKKLSSACAAATAATAPLRIAQPAMSGRLASDASNPACCHSQRPPTISTRDITTTINRPNVDHIASTSVCLKSHRKQTLSFRGEFYDPRNLGVENRCTPRSLGVPRDDTS